VDGLDLSLMAADLAEEFTRERFTHRNGSVLITRVPFDLGLLASDLFGIHDGAEAYRVINKAVDASPLAIFEWVEDDAHPWTNSLDLIPFEDRTYVAMSPDEAVNQEWEAIAALKPFSVEIAEAFFIDLGADNGLTYGVDLFSSLPTRVTSSHLSREVVAAAFTMYLDWDERRNPGAWRTAAEYLPQSVCHDLDLRAAAVELVAEDSEANRHRYIDAYTAVVYNGTPAGAAASMG